MDGKKAKKQLSSATSSSSTITYKQFSQSKSKDSCLIPPPLSLRSRTPNVSSTRCPKTSRSVKTPRPTTNTAQDNDFSKNTSKSDPKRPTSATTTLPPYALSRLKKQVQEPNTPQTSRGATSKQKSSMSPRSNISSRCSSNISGNMNTTTNNKNHRNRNYTSNNNNNNHNSSITSTSVNDSNFKGPGKSRLSKSCTSARSNFSRNNNILSGMSKEFQNSQLGADIQLFMNHPLFSTIMAETSQHTTTKKTSEKVNGSNKIQENSRKSSSNTDNFDINNINNDYQDLTDEKIHQEIETMLQKLQTEAMKEQEKIIYHDADDSNNNTLVLANAKNSISEANLNPILNSNQAKKLKSESSLKKKIPIQHLEASGSSSSTSSVNRIENRNKSKMTVTKVPLVRTASIHSHREREKIEIPDEIKHLVYDDFDEDALRQKMALLKNRYQHIVKTELVNLVLTPGDDLLPENSTSPEFVKTLMGLVEKDKEVANIAVDLVQEIDLLEKAELSYSTKKALMVGDGDEEIAAFQELWQNHKTSRTQITRNLERERDELFKDKYKPETKRPHEQESNKIISENRKHYGENNTDTEIIEIYTAEKQDHVKEKNENLLKLQSEVNKDLEKVFLTDFFEKSMEKMKKQAKKVRESKVPVNVESSLENTSDDKESEIKRGLGKLLRCLDCDSSVNHNDSSNTNDILLLIQEKMKALRENIQDLRKLSNKQN